MYQADFNAERAAREKIAGEKADLEEQIRKIQQRQRFLVINCCCVRVISVALAAVFMLIYP